MAWAHAEFKRPRVPPGGGADHGARPAPVSSGSRVVRAVGCADTGKAASKSWLHRHTPRNGPGFCGWAVHMFNISD